MPTMIKSVISQNLKKVILKWGEIPVDNNYLKGVIKINGYRRYTFSSEVDVVFEGKIFVRVNRTSEWYDTSIYNKYKISKVKLNRFLRKKCLEEIKIRLNYFDVSLNDYSSIKKINWK